MYAYESLRVALRALRANKMRSGLTMLGMIIGVSAVITLMSLGKGAERQITDQIQSMGTNLLFITPGAPRQSGTVEATRSQPVLTVEDAEAIASSAALPSFVLVAPETSLRTQVVAGPVNISTRIVGITPPYQEVRNLTVVAGEFIDDHHVHGRSLVTVLGSHVADQLFPDTDPVGQTIKVDRITFRVIGMLEAKGMQVMGNQDDMILAPISTVQQRIASQRTIGGGRTVQSINVQVAEREQMPAVVEEIAALLRERHRVAQDDFTIRSQEDLLAVVQEITGIMTLLLGSIAGISLLVGGIGIMNIMLVSVTERTREIGIRKAVGAKRNDILAQFLIEAMVVSLIGGILGILLGAGASSLIALIEVEGQSIPTAVTLDSVLLATGVAAAVGLFFGIYPASRAAKLNPIEALRYE